VSVPLTHTASIVRTPFSGGEAMTCTIWFDGGGGECTQAPKYGTSRNSFSSPFTSSSGTT
jgi:hypothetical protein